MIAQRADNAPLDSLEFTAKRRKTGLHLVFAINSETVAHYCNGFVASGPIPDGQEIPTNLHADAIALHNRGWHPLPLGGADGKQLLETQITGYSPNDATPDEIRFWPSKFGARWRNTGVRCPIGVIGIDADDYESHGKTKTGLATIAEHESRFGEKLPATYISTARLGGSGIRWFRVPDDWRGPGVLRRADGAAGDVELIVRTHRYGTVPCSVHYSGAPYRLYGPDGREIVDGLLPSPDALSELPQSWRDGLAALCPAKARGKRFNREEIELWLDAYTGSDYAHGLQQVVKRLHRLIDDGTKDRHHAMVDCLPLALKEVRAGGYPGREAERRLRGEWLAIIAGAPNHDEAEFDAMLPWAIGQAEADDHAGRWARMCRNYGEDTRDYTGLAADVPFHTESGEAAASEPRRRNAPLDLRQLRTTPPQPISWLLPDVLAHDSYVSLSAAPGTGKSVLTRAIAADASLGRSAFDPSHAVEPAKVIYLDAENGQDWWRAGLDSMGAPMDLPNLSVVCYPDVGGLDTAKGAGEFRALIADLADELGGVDLVVLDTVSRFIDGGENDADTWSQFYRLAIQPLRDQKVAILRLDHLGKDADKGPRGSSHKLSDVDADFRMTVARAGSDDLTLTLGKRRRQHFAQTLTVTRKDGPLRHELRMSPASFVVRTADGKVTTVDPDTNALVVELDRTDIDPALSRRNAQAAYMQVGGALSAGVQVWAAAVRFRKERAKQPKSDGTENDSDAGGGDDDGSK
jgi:hypothetical protein